LTVARQKQNARTFRERHLAECPDTGGVHHYVGPAIIWDNETVSLNGIVPFYVAPHDNAGTGLRICQHTTPHSTRAKTNYHYISATLPPQTKNALDSGRERRKFEPMKSQTGFK
jgi:hypothetical protein